MAAGKTRGKASKQSAESAGDTKRMKIGELAEHAGVTARTIRFYERLGLIPPGQRVGRGYRYFDTATLDRLEDIRALKKLGKSLDEIAAALEERFPQKDKKKARKRALKALNAQLAETDARIEELKALRRRLKMEIVGLEGAGRATRD